LHSQSLSLHDALPISVVVGVTLPDGEYREGVLAWLRIHSKVDLAVRLVRILVAGVADVVLIGVLLVRVGNQRTVIREVVSAVAVDRKSTRLNSSHVKI